MAAIPPRITALLNQKGGVGKTTSTVNVGAAIAALGRPTLLVDLDPQSHLSLHLGVDGGSVGRTVYDALVDPDVPLRDCLVQVRDDLWLLPSTTDLAGAETELAAHPDRNRILRARFEPLREEFRHVLIDCPPSLGVLTLNGLCLADEVVVPMQAQFLAMQGLTKLLETVQLIAQGLHPALRVGGVILCMHESQTAHSREVVQELSNFFAEHAGSGLPWDGARVLTPAIRRNVKLAEAPSFGQTIFDYAPWCPGAIDYRALAERFVRDWEVAHGVPEAEAGRPTPVATARAAAQAAAQAAAAAAAATAFSAHRFTSETASAAAAAARAARVARTSSTPSSAPASAPPPAMGRLAQPVKAADAAVLPAEAVPEAIPEAIPEVPTSSKPSRRGSGGAAAKTTSGALATSTEQVEVKPPAKAGPRASRKASTTASSSPDTKSDPASEPSDAESVAHPFRAASRLRSP